ncbi:MAG: DUF72 domain-containing protein [Actinomycetota bacterium]|nr:DUF72 domain-containing protein [Actinomycetota bacterium]
MGATAWTDKTLIESGWYPPEARTPEARLRHYASRFDVTEVDSTYYGLPSERNAALWVERTPKGFVFDVKAFSLMTGHPTRARGLPAAVRGLLPPDHRGNVYPDHVPPEGVDLVWDMFRSALMPLHSAGKLGVIVFQFPEWFMPGRPSREEMVRCRDRLPDYDIAVELRQRRWFGDEGSAARTLDFLRGEDIPLVCVDMPQGFDSSVPAMAEATSERFAMVRFHGRNEDTWGQRGAGVHQRFRYEYGEDELREWVPRVRDLAGRAAETHALFNNCYRDYATRNARSFAQMVLEREEEDG